MQRKLTKKTTLKKRRIKGSYRKIINFYKNLRNADRTGNESEQRMILEKLKYVFKNTFKKQLHLEQKLKDFKTKKRTNKDCRRMWSINSHYKMISSLFEAAAIAPSSIFEHICC